MSSTRSLSFLGSHKEIGRQVGELYKSWGKNGMSVPPHAEQYFSTQLAIYEKYFPLYLEYLEGVAEGMGVSSEIVLKNAIQAYSSPDPHKCSVFALKNDTGVFVGRNYDWREASEDHSKLYSFSYTDTPESSFTALTDLSTWNIGDKANPADFWIYTDEAWSAHGLFMCLNGAPDYAETTGITSGHTIQLVVEQCRTTVEALELIQTLPLDSSKIFTIADKSGDFAVVEVKVGQGVYVRRAQDFIYTTNHYNHEELKVVNAHIFDEIPFHSTFARYHYLETMLLKYGESMNLEKILEIMNKPPVLQNWRGVDRGDTLTIWILALELVSGKYEVKFAPLKGEEVVEDYLDVTLKDRLLRL
jgi:predicted choloylglycine hydrolase